MEREQAIQITGAYFDAWIKNDGNALSKLIDDAVIIRECTGAVIQGKNEAEAWFSAWNQSDNRVEHWIIRQFGYDAAVETAFVEWQFKCRYESEDYEWDGASIIRFKDRRIVELNEYEMKQDKFYPYQETLR